ncbi:hypothetical protein [Altererythrobacter xiamenensis]|uniref:hypothetical protein n=1 Tax=Altererythrobacter xiamenensis TaxID=1316679 RepID=UPI0011776063|nr:hypothetical protein [Altererythrobacter xiamenensis]
MKHSAVAMLAVISSVLSACSAQVEEPITASLIWDSVECSGTEWPLAIDLTNNTGESTREVEWDFSVKLKNHSNELVHRLQEILDAPVRSTDRIIAPGETYRVCSSEPPLKEEYERSELEYTVIASATFMPET